MHSAGVEAVFAHQRSTPSESEAAPDGWIQVVRYQALQHGASDARVSGGGSELKSPPSDLKYLDLCLGAKGIGL